MASTIEVGHAKNVAALNNLIALCTSYGAAYNPANANIIITALEAKYTAAMADLQAVKAAKAAYDIAINQREETFAPCKQYATRVVNALSALPVSKLTIEDAKGINRKIQGQRSSKIKTPPADPTSSGDKSTISVSQQSFDSIIDHFGKLQETLSHEPLYTPNEPELSLTAITTLIANMQATNLAALNATVAHSNTRIARDKTLYDPATGLVPLALDTKKYIKSLFGNNSTQYKQVAKIKFRTITT